jgi:hypothetical protein
MARTEEDFATTRVEDLVDPSDGDVNGVLPGGCYEEDTPGEPIPENTGIVIEDDDFPTEHEPHDPIPENTGIVIEDDDFPTEHEPHDPHGEVYSIVAEDDSFPTQHLPPDPSDEEAYEDWLEDVNEEFEEMVDRGELQNDMTTMAFGEGDDAPYESGPVTEPVIVDELPDSELPPELIDVDPVTEPVIVDDLPEGELPPELIFVVEEPAPVTEPVIVDDLPDSEFPPELIDVDPVTEPVIVDELPVDDWADVAL